MYELKKFIKMFYIASNVASIFLYKLEQQKIDLDSNIPLIYLLVIVAIKWNSMINNLILFLAKYLTF
jgi:hypothetical protein